MIKDLKQIIWKEKIIEPNELLIRFWNNKGCKFTQQQLDTMRFYKAETILRKSRELAKPNYQTKLI